MPVSKKTFILDPTNNISNSEFSFKNGSPIVKFTIPSVEALLEVSSLELAGQYIPLNSSSEPITTSGYNIEIQIDTNDNEATPPLLMAEPTKLNFSNFGGVHTFIRKVEIGSKKSKVELVNDDSYPLAAALKQATKYGHEQFKNEPLIESLSCGIYADKLQRHLNIVGGDTAMPSSLQGQYFSFKLAEGLLDKYPLSLSPNGLGGLDITLYLNNDIQVYHTRWNDQTDINNSIQGYSYLLKNLKLVGRYINLAPEEWKKYEPLMTYSQPIGFLNNVYSSMNSSTYTPQLNYVQSIVNMFKPTDAENNLYRNSFNYPMLSGLSSITTSKNGLRYPQDYTVVLTPNPNEMSTPQQLQFKVLAYGDAELALNNYKALHSGTVPPKTSLSLKLSMENLEDEYAAIGSNMFPDFSTISTDYTMGYGMYQNFMNQTYALETNSLVNTSSGKVPQSGKTFLMQTLINNITELNQTTLQSVI